MEYPEVHPSVPENGLGAKTGRGPEDDLKPYCKNGLGAKLQYPSDWPEDDLKPLWEKCP